MPVISPTTYRLFQGPTGHIAPDILSLKLTPLYQQLTTNASYKTQIQGKIVSQDPVIDNHGILIFYQETRGGPLKQTRLDLSSDTALQTIHRDILEAAFTSPEARSALPEGNRITNVETGTAELESIAAQLRDQVAARDAARRAPETAPSAAGTSTSSAALSAAPPPPLLPGAGGPPPPNPALRDILRLNAEVVRLRGEIARLAARPPAPAPAPVPGDHPPAVPRRGRRGSDPGLRRDLPPLHPEPAVVVDAAAPPRPDPRVAELAELRDQLAAREAELEGTHRDLAAAEERAGRAEGAARREHNDGEAAVREADEARARLQVEVDRLRADLETAERVRDEALERVEELEDEDEFHDALDRVYVDPRDAQLAALRDQLAVRERELHAAEERARDVNEVLRHEVEELRGNLAERERGLDAIVIERDDLTARNHDLVTIAAIDAADAERRHAAEIEALRRIIAEQERTIVAHPRELEAQRRRFETHFDEDKQLHAAEEEVIERLGLVANEREATLGVASSEVERLRDLIRARNRDLALLEGNLRRVLAETRRANEEGDDDDDLNERLVALEGSLKNFAEQPSPATIADEIYQIRRDQLQALLDEKQDSVDFLEQVQRASQEQITELQARIAELENEMRRLLDEPFDAANLDEALDAALVNDENERLRTELRGKEKALGTLQAAFARSQALVTNGARRLEKLNEALATLERVTLRRIAELEEALKRSRAEAVANQDALVRGREEQARLQNALAESERNKSVAEEEARRLQAELERELEPPAVMADTSTAEEGALSPARTLEADLAELRKAYDEAEKDNAELEELSRELANKLDAEKRKVQELTGTQENLLRRNSELEAEVNELRARLRRVGEVEKRNARLEVELSEANARLSELEKGDEEEREKIRAEQARLREENAELHREVARLLRALENSSTRAEKSATDYDARRRELTTERERIVASEEAAQRRVATLTEKLSAAQRETAQADKLVSANAATSAENAHLLARAIEERDAANTALLESQRRLRVAELELLESQAALRAATAQTETVQRELEAVRAGAATEAELQEARASGTESRERAAVEELARLKPQLTTAQEEARLAGLATLDAHASIGAAHLANAEEVRRLEVEATKARADLAAAVEEKRDLRAQNTNLLVRLEANEKETASLRRKLARTKAKLERLAKLEKGIAAGTAAFTELEASYREMNVRLRALQVEREKLQGELARTGARADKAEARAKRAEETAASATVATGTHAREIEDLQGELEALRSNMRELEEVNAALKRELATKPSHATLDAALFANSQHEHIIANLRKRLAELQGVKELQASQAAKMQVLLKRLGDLDAENKALRQENLALRALMEALPTAREEPAAAAGLEATDAATDPIAWSAIERERARKEETARKRTAETPPTRTPAVAGPATAAAEPQEPLEVRQARSAARGAAVVAKEAAKAGGKEITFPRSEAEYYKSFFLVLALLNQALPARELTGDLSDLTNNFRIRREAVESLVERNAPQGASPTNYRNWRRDRFNKLIEILIKYHAARELTARNLKIILKEITPGTIVDLIAFIKLLKRLKANPPKDKRGEVTLDYNNEKRIYEAYQEIAIEVLSSLRNLFTSLEDRVSIPPGYNYPQPGRHRQKPGGE